MIWSFASHLLRDLQWTFIAILFRISLRVLTFSLRREKFQTKSSLKYSVRGAGLFLNLLIFVQFLSRKIIYRYVFARDLFNLLTSVSPFTWTFTSIQWGSSPIFIPLQKFRILNFSRSQISNTVSAFHFRAEIQVPALVVALNASA